MPQIREVAAIDIDTQWHSFLDNAQSFRYVPNVDAPFTVRREKSKRGDGDYWYGYRKISGKLHKRYIGKSGDLTVEKLEAVAALLNAPTEPRQQNSALELPTTEVKAQTKELAHTEEIEGLQAEVARLQKQLQNTLGKKKA